MVERIRPDACRVVRVMLITGNDFIGVRVKLIQPTAKGRNPNHALLILKYLPHYIIADTIRITGIMFIVCRCFCCFIELHQSA